MLLVEYYFHVPLGGNTVGGNTSALRRVEGWGRTAEMGGRG